MRVISSTKPLAESRDIRLRRTGRGSRTTAFTLVELLFTLMLLTTIGVMAAHFVVPVIGSMREARAEATANARFDNAINLMRDDVWKAVAIQLKPGNQLLLTMADDKTIQWQFGPDHRLIRTGPAAAAESWVIPTSSIQFTVAGPVLDVHVADARHFHGGNFRMVSPVLLGGNR